MIGPAQTQGYQQVPGQSMPGMMPPRPGMPQQHPPGVMSWTIRVSESKGVYATTEHVLVLVGVICRFLAESETVSFRRLY